MTQSGNFWIQPRITEEFTSTVSLVLHIKISVNWISCMERNTCIVRNSIAADESWFKVTALQCR